MVEGGQALESRKEHTCSLQPAKGVQVAALRVSTESHEPKPHSYHLIPKPLITSQSRVVNTPSTGWVLRLQLIVPALCLQSVVLNSVLRLFAKLRSIESRSRMSHCEHLSAQRARRRGFGVRRPLQLPRREHWPPRGHDIDGGSADLQKAGVRISYPEVALLSSS